MQSNFGDTSRSPPLLTSSDAVARDKAGLEEPCNLSNPSLLWPFLVRLREGAKKNSFCSAGQIAQGLSRGFTFQEMAEKVEDMKLYSEPRLSEFLMMGPKYRVDPGLLTVKDAEICIHSTMIRMMTP